MAWLPFQKLKQNKYPCSPIQWCANISSNRSCRQTFRGKTFQRGGIIRGSWAVKAAPGMCPVWPAGSGWWRTTGPGLWWRSVAWAVAWSRTDDSFLDCANVTIQFYKPLFLQPSGITQVGEGASHFSDTLYEGVSYAVILGGRGRVD